MLEAYKMAQKRSTAYFWKTIDNAGSAVDILVVNLSMSHIPYYAKEFHTASILYPFAHTLHALRDIYNTLEGIVWLSHALFNEPETSVPEVLKGMAFSLGSMLLNCLSAIGSLVTLLTRSLSTLFYLGYPCNTGIYKDEDFDLRTMTPEGEDEYVRSRTLTL